MNLNKINTILCLFLGVLLTGCGFHLRGSVSVPPELQTLCICPHDPFSPLQKYLRITLKNNGVCLVDYQAQFKPNCATLTLISESIVDRPIAFGIDGQNNRMLIQLTVVYQIINMAGHDLICPTTIQVERELNVNPNAVLGTQSERDRVLLDLYHDATAQIMRNLTPPCE